MIGIPGPRYNSYWMLQRLAQSIPVVEKYGLIKEGINFDIFPQELHRLEEEYRNGNFLNVLREGGLIWKNWINWDAFSLNRTMDANTKTCCDELSKLECNRTRL